MGDPFNYNKKKLILYEEQKRDLTFANKDFISKVHWF